jgi:hypothetical protein
MCDTHHNKSRAELDTLKSPSRAYVDARLTITRIKKRTRPYSGRVRVTLQDSEMPVGQLVGQPRQVVNFAHGSDQSGRIDGHGAVVAAVVDEIATQ